MARTPETREPNILTKAKNLWKVMVENVQFFLDLKFSSSTAKEKRIICGQRLKIYTGPSHSLIKTEGTVFGKSQQNSDQGSELTRLSHNHIPPLNSFQATQYQREGGKMVFAGKELCLRNGMLFFKVKDLRTELSTNKRLRAFDSLELQKLTKKPRSRRL